MIDVPQLPDLWQSAVDDAWARSNDPATAHDAAQTTNAARMNAIVVKALRELGPSTTEELAAHTGESLVSVSPRMRPLARQLVVEEAGKRKNASGKMAIAWRLRR